MSGRGPMEQTSKMQLRDQLAAMTILCRALVSKFGSPVTLEDSDLANDHIMKIKSFGASGIEVRLVGFSKGVN